MGVVGRAPAIGALFLLGEKYENCEIYNDIISEMPVFSKRRRIVGKFLNFKQVLCIHHSEEIDTKISKTSCNSTRYSVYYI
jgi:hypothetical protein